MANTKQAIKSREEFTAAIDGIIVAVNAGPKSGEDFSALADKLDDAHKYAFRCAKLHAKLETL